MPLFLTTAYGISEFKNWSNDKADRFSEEDILKGI